MLSRSHSMPGSAAAWWCCSSGLSEANRRSVFEKMQWTTARKRREESKSKNMKIRMVSHRGSEQAGSSVARRPDVVFKRAEGVLAAGPRRMSRGRGQHKVRQEIAEAIEPLEGWCTFEKAWAMADLILRTR